MHHGVRSKLGVVAVLALVMGSVAVIGARPAGATTVADEASLRTAFGDASETSIVLTADITLTACGSGSVQRSSATPITVDGQGRYSITQTCTDVGVLAFAGGGGGALSGITLVGGSSGVLSDAPLVVTASHITGQTSPTSVVFGIAATFDLVLTDVVIDQITAVGAAYGASSGTVTATRVTITDLTAGPSSFSFGIVGESVTLTDASISRLTGDGVYGVTASSGPVVIASTAIHDLHGTAGFSVGAYSTSGGSLTGSSITDVAGEVAVGIYNSSPVDFTVVRSTIARLTGSLFAFGIYTDSTPDLTVVNSTVASVTGPAILSGGDTTLVYSTISDSGSSGVPGAGVSVESPTSGSVTLDLPLGMQIRGTGALVMFGSVVVQNAVGAPNCEVGSTASVGYNFADDASCGLTGTGDRQGAGLDALLGGLADNGGPGPTRLPQAGSPLLDAIPDGACRTGPAAGVTADERSLPRPAIGGCDIGAVEVQPLPEPTFTG